MTLMILMCNEVILLGYVLFGAGDIGKRVGAFFRNDSVDFYVDNNQMKANTLIEGIPVFPYSKKELMGKWSVISTEKKKAMEIAKQLEKDDIKTYIFWDEILSMYSTPDLETYSGVRDLQMVKEKLEKIFCTKFMLTALVLSVGSKCNFHCEHCGNMVPLSPKDTWSYSLDDIVRWLHDLLSKVDFINYLQIQGGEPFLYPQLKELIRYIGDNKQISNVVIATNGSIVPSKEVLEIFKNFHITIRISDYDFNKVQARKLFDICKEIGVYAEYYQFAGGNHTWYDLGQKDVLRENENAVVKRRFEECPFRDCLTLERAEISHCSRSPNAYLIQGFKRNEDDYISVDGSDGMLLSLRQYVMQPKFMTSCRYCYGADKRVKLQAGAQRAISYGALEL